MQENLAAQPMADVLQQIVQTGVENAITGLRTATEGSFTDVYQTLAQHHNCLDTIQTTTTAQTEEMSTYNTATVGLQSFS